MSSSVLRKVEHVTSASLAHAVKLLIHRTLWRRRHHHLLVVQVVDMRRSRMARLNATPGSQRAALAGSQGQAVSSMPPTTSALLPLLRRIRYADAQLHQLEEYILTTVLPAARTDLELPHQGNARESFDGALTRVFKDYWCHESNAQCLGEVTRRAVGVQAQLVHRLEFVRDILWNDGPSVRSTEERARAPPASIPGDAGGHSVAMTPSGDCPTGSSTLPHGQESPRSRGSQVDVRLSLHKLRTVQSTLERGVEETRWHALCLLRTPAVVPGGERRFQMAIEDVAMARSTRQAERNHENGAARPSEAGNSPAKQAC